MSCHPLLCSASAWRRSYPMASLPPRRLNRGRTQTEWIPGPIRASPISRKGPRPPLRRSASARRHPCRLARLRPRRLNLGWTPPEWAPGPTRASPGGRGRALPRVARLRPGYAFAAWLRLRVRARAGAGPDPTRVAFRPHPDFAPPGASPVGTAAPFPTLLRSCLATPAQPGRAFERERGPRLARPQASWLPARPGLRPAGRGYILP